jgi:uncharacterized membrane protein YeaQ/YmgE (transglycosylase-associated protein family)
MGILLFLVFGLVVGLLSRALMPGRQGMSMGMTAILGIAGSLLGGFIASLLTHNRLDQFNTAGLIGSIAGSILLLVLVGGRTGKRALL